MATISDILNVVQCGLGNTLGTGTKGCEAFFKKTASLWITKRGFKYDSTRTLNNAYIEELKASGDLIILKRVKTFEDNSSDDTIETLSDQTSSVASLGLYQFTYGFTKGLGFLSALASLRSFNSYDVAFVDVENNILSTSASDGSMKGFSTNMLNPSRLSFATDSEGIQKQYITLQLSERDELDTDRRVFVDKGSLESGFYPKTIDGVNEVVVAFSVVPSAGSSTTQITAKATLKQDGSAFTGASHTQFSVTNNGSPSNPTSGNDNATAGTYVLTIPTYAEDDVLKFHYMTLLTIE